MNLHCKSKFLEWNVAGVFYYSTYELHELETRSFDFPQFCMKIRRNCVTLPARARACGGGLFSLTFYERVTATGGAINLAPSWLSAFSSTFE